VKPEIEAFDLSMIFKAVEMQKAGKITGPMHVQFVMGVKNAMAAAAAKRLASCSSRLVQAVLANIVRTPSAMLIATTCDELRPLAFSAAAASGVASMDFRSD
jgi:uncharacterized protein (DUF849 family)